MKYAHPVAISIFALVPYALVAWAYNLLNNDDASGFWTALGVLIGVRFFFFIIETLGDVLCWRLYKRSLAVENALTFLKANGFPQRKFKEDDLGGYLARIQDDRSILALRSVNSDPSVVVAHG
jgi:hypothetical protein